MPQIANTRKNFQFYIEIDGVNQMEIQKVQHPKVAISKTEHGEYNSKVKTAGMVEVEDMVFQKVRPAPQSDTWAWDLLTTAQDPESGSGGLAEDYKFDFVLRELHPDQVSILNSWLVTGAWVREIGENESDRTSSEAKMEAITLSIDKIKRI